jgi:hypothetical protein
LELDHGLDGIAKRSWPTVVREKDKHRGVTGALVAIQEHVLLHDVYRVGRSELVERLVVRVSDGLYRRLGTFVALAPMSSSLFAAETIEQVSVHRDHLIG